MDALTTFHFLRPWWLLAVPLWLWLSFYVWRKGQSGDGWAAVCDPALLTYLTGNGAGVQQRSNMALAALMLAGALALLALAGPAWQQLPQPVYRAQSALVIGLDLSRSMLAADVKPNRLQRAKQKLQDILFERKEGQTGLVVFAGAAFDVVPLTSDNNAILALLGALEPSMMPAQGSRASTALEQAEAIFKRNAIQRGTVVLLTDGVDADALDMAARLVKAGHRVSVIGVGTKAGAPIPASGEAGGFIKDSSGNIVIPHLDTDMLKQLADAGHGVYRAIRFDDQDINAIPGLKPSVTDRVSRQETLQTDLWREEGPWLLLLMLPLLSLVFRRGVLLSWFLLPIVMISTVMMPSHADAMAWQDLWQTPDQQGQALMRQNKPVTAAGLFKNPDWKGAALYRAKKYKEAAAALARPDSADGWYNRGNALAKAGDLKAAVDAYEHALKLDKTNKDAAFNRDLVKKAMQQSHQQKSDKKNRGEQQKNKQGKQGGENKGQNQSGSQQDESKPSGQRKPGQQQGQKKQQDQQSADAKQADQQKAKQDQTEQQRAGQKQEQKKKDEQQAGAKPRPGDKPQDGKKTAAATDKAESWQDKEASAALQQWLRRIPDDPGGLLRRKFQYQYQQQQPDEAGGQQAW
ncbi:MAG: VWA domain-containing protein [Mariprofundus sp.]|nr:VWA domain-containing protein [Mariprofundus sp.]